MAMIELRRLAGATAGFPQSGRSMTCYLATQKLEIMGLMCGGAAGVAERRAARQRGGRLHGAALSRAWVAAQERLRHHPSRALCAGPVAALTSSCSSIDWGGGEPDAF
eukprot:8779573-Pyramimonas_sp.AAC.2